MSLVKRINIHANGDPSVGIFPSDWYITSHGFVLDLDCFAEEDRELVIQETKEALRILFSEYFAGEPVEVEFEF